MKKTKRFNQAVMVLYNAFHENRLDAFSCKACVVGNMIKGSKIWRMNNVIGIEKGLSPVKAEGRYYSPPFHKDYSEQELLNIEAVFLTEWSKEKSYDGTNKEIQFKGLCAVVEYLCELDGIKNVLDYTKIFETENDKPKYQLI